jgi:soluble lytic murein transglycosylase-like protein
MLPLELMPSSIRVFLIAAVLFSAGYLATPGAAGAEPDLASAWTGEPGTEPPALSTGDLGGDVSPAQQPAGPEGWAAPEVDLWAEFFTAPVPAAAKTEPVPSAPAQPRATASARTTPGKPDSDYQIQQNDHVQRFLEQFQTGYRRAVVERWLTRSGRYLPMILDVFRQKGLPEELVFTAMIESGFNPVAVSHAGAKGLWQFMAPTARRYGLRVDRWLDERLDPEKSTVAAANYFKDLYALFGSWELSQAAYNAGEMKVLRAIQGTGTRDFWSLTRSRLLRDETKNYVPAIHAVTIIGQEPEQYGFAVTPDEPLSYEQITVPRGTSLKHVAGLSGIPLEDLVRLNSELRLKQTPPDSPYHLKVPLGSAAALQAGLDREIEERKNAMAARAADRSKRKGQIAAQKVPAPAKIAKPRAARPRDSEQGGFR